MDKECVDKVYVDKVCVDKECVDKECVDKVCVDKECVGVREGGRRRTRSTGVQNQKQEPHTKLWGTKTPHVNVGKNTVIEGSLEVKNFRQYRQTKRRDGKRQREEKDWKKED